MPHSHPQAAVSISQSDHGALVFSGVHGGSLGYQLFHICL